jgi:hypothetical protein
VTLHKVNTSVHDSLKAMDDQARRITVSNMFDLHLDMAVVWSTILTFEGAFHLS